MPAPAICGGRPLPANSLRRLAVADPGVGRPPRNDLRPRTLARKGLLPPSRAARARFASWSPPTASFQEGRKQTLNTHNGGKKKGTTTKQKEPTPRPTVHSLGSLGRTDPVINGQLPEGSLAVSLFSVSGFWFPLSCSWPSQCFLPRQGAGLERLAGSAPESPSLQSAPGGSCSCRRDPLHFRVGASMP